MDWMSFVYGFACGSLGMYGFSVVTWRVTEGRWPWRIGKVRRNERRYDDGS